MPTVIRTQDPEVDLVALRAQMEAELRTQITQEIAAERFAAEQAAYEEARERELAARAEVEQNTTFTPVGFWCVSPYHEPRILRPGGGGFLHFKNGYFLAKNPVDADLIRAHLTGVAFEEDWPVGNVVKPCTITGYAPRSIQAYQAYQDYVRPISSAY